MIKQKCTLNLLPLYLCLEIHVALSSIMRLKPIMLLTECHKDVHVMLLSLSAHPPTVHQGRKWAAIILTTDSINSVTLNSGATLST